MWKYLLVIMPALFSVVQVACTASEGTIQTAIAETITAISIPITDTPVPTATLLPTVTPFPEAVR